MNPTRALLCATPLLLAACGTDSAGGEPTWSSHIAALVHENCTTCHRPGESAPFALRTYEDAFRKRRQIVRVTERRIMPPWLPTHGDFVDSRGLDGDQVDLLAEWVAAGAPRGDENAEPAPPEFPAGWQLREPDLVLTASEAVPVPAAGPDMFCNLVLPVELASMRYVEAVELRPGSAAVHHAILQLDGTHDSRRRAAQDPGPGFAGMAMGISRAPDGHFIGWTPGKLPHRNPPGFAWRLWPGNDLVLQLHLTPTGKPEHVQPRIGLYFTDAKTTVQPFPLVMRSEAIDIAPGQTDFVARDHITLPVAVAVHAIYPHAHYLCATMRAWATSPDDAVQTLFQIDRWDFDWQDDYRYRVPLQLPAGTRIDFEYRYDNSAANPNNPSSPPRRVTYGLESEDEMATLSLTLVALDPAQRPALPLAAARRDVERIPGDANCWINLSVALRETGDPVRGAQAARQALVLQAGNPAAHRELGICLTQAGDAALGEASLLQALQLDGGDGIGRMHLGEVLARSGRTREAIAQFDLALAAHSNYSVLQNNLATALFIDEQLERAAVHYERATVLDPEYFNAWFNRGRVLMALGREEQARAALQVANGLRPGHAGVAEALQELGGG